MENSMIRSSCIYAAFLLRFMALIFVEIANRSSGLIKPSPPVKRLLRSANVFSQLRPCFGLASPVRLLYTLKSFHSYMKPLMSGATGLDLAPHISSYKMSNGDFVSNGLRLPRFHDNKLQSDGVVNFNFNLTSSGRRFCYQFGNRMYFGYSSVVTSLVTTANIKM